MDRQARKSTAFEESVRRTAAMQLAPAEAASA